MTKGSEEGLQEQRAKTGLGRLCLSQQRGQQQSKAGWEGQAQINQRFLKSYDQAT